MQSYKELTVWQKSIALVTSLYKLTDTFPKSELFGLTSQLRRAAISIPSNISEGYARKHRGEYIQFLRIAFGSGSEIETQLIIAKELGFIDDSAYQEIQLQVAEVMRMLNKMISSLVAKP